MDWETRPREDLMARIHELEKKLEVKEFTSNGLHVVAQRKSTALLKEYFSLAQARNPNFSLRAFAKRIGMSPGKVSEIFSGKYGLSLELAQRVINQLSMNPEEKMRFIESVEKEQGAIDEYRTFAKMILEKTKTHERSFNLLHEEEDIEFIDHWSYYALMSILELTDGEKTLAWISQRIHLDEDLVDERLEKLSRMGIVEKKDDQYFLLKNNNYNDGHHLREKLSQVAAMKCSASAFRHIAEKLEVQLAMDKVPTSNENKMFVFVDAIDSSKLTNIPNFLAQNIHNSMEELSNSKLRDEVYMVNMSFIKI